MRVVSVEGDCRVSKLLGLLKILLLCSSNNDKRKDCGSCTRLPLHFLCGSKVIREIIARKPRNEANAGLTHQEEDKGEVSGSGAGHLAVPPVTLLEGLYRLQGGRKREIRGSYYTSSTSL